MQRRTLPGFIDEPIGVPTRGIPMGDTLLIPIAGILPTFMADTILRPISGDGTSAIVGLAVVGARAHESRRADIRTRWPHRSSLT